MTSAAVITGWIAAVLFLLDFGTCLVMPWTKKEIEELEELKDKDCEEKGCKGCQSKGIQTYHKTFVILAIISIIVHIFFVIVD